jgi:N-acyl-D-aspartate/D-glutamate deacylase
MLDRGSTADELDWIARLAQSTEVPVSYMVLQTDTDPDLWRAAMDKTTELTDRGLPLWVQVAARPFGMLIGLATNHPFLKRPTYEALRHLPLADQAAEMRRPEVAAAILSEPDSPLDPDQPFDGLGPFLQIMLDRLFPMGRVPDYEPLAETSIGLTAASSAGNADQSIKLQAAYEAMTAGDGTEMFLLPLFNYTHSNHDAIREMLLHPRSVSSLGDAGAHCGMICDASIPTYLLTHWARDRSRGERLPIEFLVKKQTHDTARLYGLTDRGTLEPGMRADVNVIDYANLQLLSPRLVHDLPAGGRRLLQDASGYDATLCAGTVVSRNGADTGARLGRLIRSGT